ncbi:hypothetical protein AAG570_009179 [Ranatra chinensis]|uniref:Uncharacterized protein n=1 Tax=Ranatra chinensis TaxID=642074 RepID=A0ABD0YSZ7_9HEMI
MVLVDPVSISTVQPHVGLHTTGKASLFTKIKSPLLPLPVPGPVSYYPIGGPAVVLHLPSGTAELNAATETAGFPAGCLGCFPLVDGSDGHSSSDDPSEPDDRDDAAEEYEGV